MKYPYKPNLQCYSKQKRWNKLKNLAHENCNQNDNTVTKYLAYT